MMTDRAVVEAEGLAELVGVRRSGTQSLEDPCAVLPSPGARDQVPEELLEGLTHRIEGKRMADMNVAQEGEGEGARACGGAGLSDVAPADDVHRLRVFRSGRDRHRTEQDHPPSSPA